MPATRKSKVSNKPAAELADAPGPVSAIPAAEQRDTDAEPSTAEDTPSRVVYLGHIPHGFYEDQMREFFGQFGTVTRVRLSRNKKTTNSKGYAYVEFALAEVAVVAAEAMDGYMMFAQKLSCRSLKESEVHPRLFKGANRKFVKKPWKKLEVERHNKELTQEEHAARLKRAVKRDQQRQKRIKAAGLDYEHEGLAKAVPKKAKHLRLDTDE